MNAENEELGLLGLLDVELLGIHLIKSLKLQNFRGIKEGSLELSPLTILLGSNNSGKTTILESLFLAPNPGRFVPYYPPPPRRGGSALANRALDLIHLLHKTLDSQGYAFLLYNYISKKALIECQFDNNTKYLLEFFTGKDNVYFKNNMMKRFSSENVDGKTIDTFGNASLHYSNSHYTDSNPFIDETLLISPNLLNYSYQHLRNNWASLINRGICRKVATDASTLSPQKYQDLTMEPFFGSALELYVFFKDGRRLRLGDLGEGIKNYILSRILFEVVSPKILLWDDIESHLNPRILRHLAEWFSDLIAKGVQVIISTHSLEATYTIAGVNEEDTSIYITSLEDSILKAKKFALKEIENLQEAGIDARTAEALFL